MSDFLYTRTPGGGAVFARTSFLRVKSSRTKRSLKRFCGPSRSAMYSFMASSVSRSQMYLCV